MSVINLIVKILTFFGAVFRASVEQLACKKQNIMVDDVKYFTKDKMCGHVSHEPPMTEKGAKQLCLRPFLLSFFLGLLILLPSAFNLFFLENFRPLVLIAYWIGISLWTNIFPSLPNAQAYKGYAMESNKGLKKFSASVLNFGAKIEATGLTLITSVLASFLLAQLVRLILPLFSGIVGGVGDLV